MSPPEARAKSGRGSLLLFCASASDQTSEMLILHRENFLQMGTSCEIVAKAAGLSFEEVAQVLRNSPLAMPLAGSNLPHSVVEEGIIHRVFSLGRCHVSDRGERGLTEVRVCTERGR